ncbi:CBM35 domain-containing protein [Acetivibrio straminisolvens]|jgi:hypothetical protein|uniref:CBM35 domain-containing protein n=1 Tax=Acetivibrio straminisolvens TaxID=253314 RepID=UPI00223EB6AB|nr:CBM35 domain-containing protein [Acetivibrio straminisolvens]
MRDLKKWYIIFLTVMLVISGISLPKSFAANQVMTVDLAEDTGEICYGAIGGLYAMGSEGVPSDNVIVPLRMKAISQKPPEGLQHPTGDALNVAPQFLRAGGEYVMIMMQDIYRNWPYEDLGINDYLSKIETICRKVVADPHRSSYVYVPINEPEWIWYRGNMNRLCSEWKMMYEKIRSIDPTAKIAGPNYAVYNSSVYRQFMTFCKNNNCLPDIVTWHELDDGFFSNWYNHYNDYRNIEKSLGISPRPININEYGRINVDGGIPGNLVQWIARFENSKVDACLAYWTTAGTLNDLVTQNNKATGAWWLYKWYGELTGHTVKVTPPSLNGSLQGLAALDKDKKQARVIFGGSLRSTDVFGTDVVVKGFNSHSFFGNSVHVTVWGVDNTGTNPSGGPYLVHEGDYNISNGQITVPVNNMKALSAYHMIITPNTDLSPANKGNRYEAEYARISGTATVVHGKHTGYSGTGFVEGYAGSNNASTNFVVTADKDGYYNVTLRYSAGPYSGAPNTRYLRMVVNGGLHRDIACNQTPDWNTWANVTIKVFLQAGINRLDFKAFASDESDCVNIDYIEIESTSGTIKSYEAEDSANTLGGSAVRQRDNAASGGQYVGWIGNGSNNYLQFNNVNVPEAGTYKMVVQFANAEVFGDHSYNNNVVDRYSSISVNGEPIKGHYFFNTRGWNIYRTDIIDVYLNAGNNTIRFYNSSSGYVPNIDKIAIAAPFEGGTVPTPTPTPTSTPTPTPTKDFVYGDLDGNGIVNSTDFSYLKRYLLRQIEEFPYEKGLIAGDVDGNGTINSTDLSYLRKYILKIISVFPADS